MSRQVPMPQDTKAGTSSNSTNEASTPKSEFANPAEINEFLDKVALAGMNKRPNEMPVVEASKKVIKHYNRGSMFQGFETAGYFIFNGVKVVLEGTMSDVDKKESESLEHKMHGTKDA